jgi:hypothetical protein
MSAQQSPGEDSVGGDSDAELAAGVENLTLQTPFEE